MLKIFRTPAISVVAPRRAFHSSRTHLIEGTHKPNSWTTKFMPIRQAIVQVPDPSKVTVSSIASRFDNLRPREDVWEKHFHPSRHAIIILATPSFASYLEEQSGFIPLLLQNINCPLTSEGPALNVDVVCGCIDGLPPAPHYTPRVRGRPVEQGFAVLYGDLAHIFPKYPLEKVAREEAKSVKPGSIIFQRAESGGMTVTLPLANTLFKNGRLSTLLASKWQATDTGYKQVKSQINIDAVSVNALGKKQEPLPELYIPAIPLTYARELQNGFGNIIRSLKFQGPDNFKYHPASSELEIKVPRFLSEALGQISALKIWALIIPPAVAERFIEPSSSTLRLPNRIFEEMNPIEDYKEIGYWISQGARLCRVQSGGGGWGPKAGMLSLDPEYTYASIPESSLTMDDAFMDENKLPGLKEIAKTGSYIQFFTARETRTLAKYNQKHSSTTTMRQATIVGTIPSSIDSLTGETTEEEKIKQQTMDITEQESHAFHQKAIELLQVPFLGPGRPEAQVEGKAPEMSPVPPPMEKDGDEKFPKGGFYTKSLNPKRDMYFRKGEFGCVSESGMFLKQKDTKRSSRLGERIETKVDIPYSFVSATFGVSTFKIRRLFG